MELVTWQKVDELADVLCRALEKRPARFGSISTVSRGGLVPARLVADRMGIDVILVDGDRIPADSVFVDDIYDTGRTFQKILSRAKDPGSLVYATLFARRGARYPKQLVYASQTEGTEYVVFPWEGSEHKRLIRAHR